MVQTVTIEDLTGSANPARRISQRDASDVDSLVLHQMGFDRGDSPLSYLNVAAHYVILRGGAIGQLHNHSEYLNSSNGLNARSVAVEFAGNMPSARGRYYSPERFGRHRVTPQQVASGRFLVRHLRDTIGITHVFAHRQATNGHTNCCGPDVWFNIGQWAVTIGLSDGGYGFTIGPGKTIPHSWRNHGHMVFTEQEANF
jgi:hypothetical protein